jgi:hypothetical protein
VTAPKRERWVKVSKAVHNDRNLKNEFGGDLDGLSEIIFSCFNKMLECFLNFLIETKTRKRYEVIPTFLQLTLLVRALQEGLIGQTGQKWKEPTLKNLSIKNFKR